MWLIFGGLAVGFAIYNIISTIREKDGSLFAFLVWA